MKLKTNFAKGFLALSALIIFALASCKKDSAGNDQGSSQNSTDVMNSAADETVANATYDDVFNTAVGIDNTTAGDDVGISGSDGLGIYSRVSSPSDDVAYRTDSSHRCFTVTVSPKGA